MKKYFYFILAAIFMAVGIHTVEAQIQAPAPSPSSTLKQTVGLTDIEIQYSRPGVKDRTIFGVIVPYDQFWRTGANSATKVSFSDDVMIGGKNLKKGSYSLFTYPGKNSWTVIFSNSTSVPGASGYDKSNDAVRLQVVPESLAEKVETFTINVANIRNNSATIDLDWENTRVSIPLSFNTDEKVFASINQVMNGPTAGDYYAAAGYYLSAGKDLKQAREWAAKAVEMTEGKQPWISHTKALIEAEMGLKSEAIKTANASINAAKAMNNDHYVMLNENLIKKLK